MEPSDESPPPSDGRRDDGRGLAADLAAGLETHQKAVARLGRLSKALSEPWSDPQALEKAAGDVQKLAGSFPPDLTAKAASLAEELSRWLREERDGRRQRLARELKEGVAERGLRLLVVTKDPLELRIPPLGVRIDLEKARAAVVFGQVEILTSPATGRDILEAREKALKSLESRKWSAREFHGQLREAWSAAARRLARPDGWVDLSEVIADVAVAVQEPRWRQDPSARNFSSYGKVHFLYDLHRLREAGGLAVDGQRLVLGPATGDSTRDKKKVFWVEDGEGRGAYHLTLRFVPEEGIHGEER